MDHQDTKENFNNMVFEKFSNECCSRDFHANIKNLMNKGSAPPWDVRSLLPGRLDQEVAEYIGEFFNSISSEYSPLDVTKLQSTFDRMIPQLTVNQVANLLRIMKKSKHSSLGISSINSTVFFRQF